VKESLPSTTLTFASATACLSNFENKVWKRPYGAGRRPKETQLQCRACGRWKYADERCNLFVPGPPPPGPQEPPRPNMKEVG